MDTYVLNAVGIIHCQNRLDFHFSVIGCIFVQLKRTVGLVLGRAEMACHVLAYCCRAYEAVSSAAGRTKLAVWCVCGQVCEVRRDCDWFTCMLSPARCEWLPSVT